MLVRGLLRQFWQHMEVAIIKRESTGSGTHLYNESETLIKFEIMDGAPVRGESIPVRLFLNSCVEHLTPTYRNVHTKFSTKYYLNLVLVDEEDRRYFKQQLSRCFLSFVLVLTASSSSSSSSSRREIILWRKPPRKKGEKKDEMAGRYERPEDVAREEARVAALEKAEAALRAREEAE